MVMLGFGVTAIGPQFKSCCGAFSPEKQPTGWKSPWDLEVLVQVRLIVTGRSNAQDLPGPGLRCPPLFAHLFGHWTTVQKLLWRVFTREATYRMEKSLGS